MRAMFPPCARSPAAPGAISNASPGRTIIGWHPTIFRNSPAAWWRTARRRPISAWACSRRWPRHDFGYVSRLRLIERLEAAFDSLDRLERYRGHLYNWYDTRTLAPLQPRYVSTVDSGNFAGHLLTLRQGLLTLATHGAIAASVAARCHRYGDGAARSRCRRRLSRAGAVHRRCARQPPTKQPCARRCARCTNRRTARPPIRWKRNRRAGRAVLRRNAFFRRRRVAELGADPPADPADRMHRLAERAAQFAVLDYEFLYVPYARPVLHRLQRHRSPARQRLLRPARLRGAAGHLRRHRPGPHCLSAAGFRSAAADCRPAARRCCCPGAARCSST